MILKIISIAAMLFFIGNVLNSKSVQLTFAKLSLRNEESVSKEGEDVAANETVQVPHNTTTPPACSANATALLVNATQANNASTLVSCHLNKSGGSVPVEIVNASRLISLLHVEPNITSRQTPANCVAVLFYSASCPFSCMAAPHFNALPRIYPSITMAAVDAMNYHSFNAQYGIVGVPTLMLFHNGRPAAKFNDTSEYTLEMFSKFITKYTGIEPEGKLFVTSADFGGPVSSIPSKDRDMLLVLSWSFIIICILHSFYRSSYWRWLVDGTVNAWREAEAQHPHVE